jgi:hypothetical protein
LHRNFAISSNQKKQAKKGRIPGAQHVAPSLSPQDLIKPAQISREIVRRTHRPPRSEPALSDPKKKKVAARVPGEKVRTGPERSARTQKAAPLEVEPAAMGAVECRKRIRTTRADSAGGFKSIPVVGRDCHAASLFGGALCTAVQCVGWGLSQRIQ